MVKPGVNHVERIPRDCRNARMRGDARAPNSPRDRAVGVVRPRAMKPDMVSKSKVRQTMWRGPAGGFGGRGVKVDNARPPFAPPPRVAPPGGTVYAPTTKNTNQSTTAYCPH